VFDHVIIDVDDLAESRAFYEQALAPIGCSVVMEFGDRCAFGPESGRPQFWLAARGGPATTGVHIAFPAPSHEAVDAFHRAALAAGGTDNGAPGLRPQYHASYYGAFVLDRHGNNVEAVHHGSVFD
jgi:catechol 2,3-dioxygenase-like lactoylglutathione lyase family enzyme